MVINDNSAYLGHFSLLCLQSTNLESFSLYSAFNDGKKTEGPCPYILHSIREEAAQKGIHLPKKEQSLLKLRVVREVLVFAKVSNLI